MIHLKYDKDQVPVNILTILTYDFSVALCYSEHIMFYFNDPVNIIIILTHNFAVTLGLL
jgi:hypothetical protein